MKSCWSTVSERSAVAKRIGPTIPATAVILMILLRGISLTIGLDSLSQHEQGKQADDGEEEVGEGVAGGPGEVGDAEGQGPLHARLLRAAREERRAWHEGGVEGPASQENQEPQDPG